MKEGMFEGQMLCEKHRRPGCVECAEQSALTRDRSANPNRHARRQLAALERKIKEQG